MNSSTHVIVTRSAGEVASTDVKLTLDSTACPPSLDFAAPWVGPQGNLMLFRAVAVTGGQCDMPGKSDIYWTRMDPATGQQVGQAHAILTGSALERVTPAMTPSLCELTYAEFNSQNPDVYHLYLAKRK
jgi:hypothetical protein